MSKAGGNVPRSARKRHKDPSASKPPSQADHLRRIRTLDLAPTAKLLLVMLESYVTINGSNDVCFPSEKTLAHDVGVSDRQVRRWIRLLEDIGELETAVVITARGNHNQYRLLRGSGH